MGICMKMESRMNVTNKRIWSIFTGNVYSVLFVMYFVFVCFSSLYILRGRKKKSMEHYLPCLYVWLNEWTVFTKGPFPFFPLLFLFLLLKSNLIDTVVFLPICQVVCSTKRSHSSWKLTSNRPNLLRDKGLQLYIYMREVPKLASII